MGLFNPWPKEPWTAALMMPGAAAFQVTALSLGASSRFSL